MKQRLDKLMAERGLAATRSQAESWIRLGRVKVDGRVVSKAGEFVNSQAEIILDAPERYVSRAGLKLASVAQALKVDFSGKVVLDVGSSTGGFTDYALQNGASKVIAVDVGTDQLHPKLRADKRVELHEKTDIRNVELQNATNEPRDTSHEKVVIGQSPGIVVIDVSFISLREILPHVACLAGRNSLIVAMVKPQFEASKKQIGSSGVIKNDTVRRGILHDFEQWARGYFTVINKADSSIAGARGNHERFYLLQKLNAK
mgnify:CR=1 FL=1